MSSNLVFGFLAVVCAARWCWSSHGCAQVSKVAIAAECGSNCQSQWGSKPKRQLSSSALSLSICLKICGDSNNSLLLLSSSFSSNISAVKSLWVSEALSTMTKPSSHPHRYMSLSPSFDLNLICLFIDRVCWKFFNGPWVIKMSPIDSALSFQRGPISLTLKGSRSNAQQRSHGNGCKLCRPGSDPGLIQ